jgi:hypothetical protein
MRRYSPILPALLLMTGCAPLANVPSLAPRPVETAVPVVAAATASLPLCVDPREVTQIGTLLDQARAADARFSAIIGRTQTSAATGSDAWIDAQNMRSVAALDHSQTAAIIAAFDTEIAALIERCDVSAYRAAQAEVQAMSDRQTAALNR